MPSPWTPQSSPAKKQGAYTDILDFSGGGFLPPGRSTWVINIVTPIGYPLIPSNFVVQSSIGDNVNQNWVILSTKITGPAQVTLTILNLEPDEVGGSYFLGITWEEAIDI